MESQYTKLLSDAVKKFSYQTLAYQHISVPDGWVVECKVCKQINESSYSGIAYSDNLTTAMETASRLVHDQISKIDIINIDNDDKTKTIDNDDKTKTINNDDKTKPIDNDCETKTIDNNDKTKTIDNDDKNITVNNDCGTKNIAFDLEGATVEKYNKLDDNSYIAIKKCDFEKILSSTLQCRRSWFSIGKFGQIIYI